MRPSSGPDCGPEWHTDPLCEAAARGHFRSLCSRSTLTGGLAEMAWVGAHLLMYPLGAWTEDFRPDPRNRPGEQPPTVRALFAADPLAARIPVVLVHGLVDNRSVFGVMRRGLRRRGFTQICTWNYSPLLTDIRRGAAALGSRIEAICEQTGHERVHVVGHSLGGLMARYHVQRQAGDRRVESLVTLGTPHRGSLLAHVIPTPLVRQLRPRSSLLRELDEPVASCSTRMTAIYSDLDQVVLPTSAGRCDHPDLGSRNLLFRGLGHMSLPRDAGVVDEVAATLAGLRDGDQHSSAAATRRPGAA